MEFLTNTSMCTLKRGVYFINSHLIRRQSQSAAEYCMQSVKKYDYENFISSMLLKNSSRACAIAVRSFNVEVARVMEQVSQESIAQMRLKFWEDTVDKCLGSDSRVVPKHPVAVELFKAHNKNKLSKRHLNNLITSRKEVIKLTSFRSLDDMENYAEKSVSNVYYLILEGSGIKNVHVDHAASHLGKAQGIVQHIRSLPQAKRINFIPIPQDILRKHHLSQETVIRAKQSESLTECIYEIASRAHQHLLKARSLVGSVPKEARSILLPAVPVSIYLERLEKVQYDVFHPSLNNRSWKLLPKLWLFSFRNKY